MLIPLFFLISIHIVTSINNQEDLSISTYHHIGCLTLKPEREYLLNYIQENPLLPYQTFSSSNLTIELCFRLCRRWLVLINKNQTNCMCLYSISKSYQLNDHLGEVLSTNNCTANDLQIYSLTEHFYILPSVSPIYDWSLDGCYYYHGIRTIQANLNLTNVNYTIAIDSCRTHCLTLRPGSYYYSFFLSWKKSCYCLPIKLLSTITPIAVRKPLIHCSFLSYIKNGFEKSSMNFSEIYPDTVIRIEVQKYCSSTFSFDRNLHLCLKYSSFDPPQNTHMKLNTGDICSPILIKTYEQWNHLISFGFLLRTRTFIWIDRNSTYLLEDLFQKKYNSSISNDLCIVVNRTNLNRSPIYSLILCSTAQSPGHVLCTQKPVETVISDQAQFKLIPNDQQSFIVNNITCPPRFVLFNKICYFIPITFVSDILSAERLCHNQYSNSTLVRFNSHDWGNVNTTIFRGRAMNDVLLEFFYYQLETKMTNVLPNKKHWLRLLLGNKTDHNECILRYYMRISGAFTFLHRCNEGGHPVCQCEPIRKEIPIIEPANNNTQIKNDSSRIENKTESSTTTEKTTLPVLLNTTELPVKSSTTTERITLPVLLNTTDIPMKSNETIIPICENCTTVPADEDLFNNETNIEYKPDNYTLILNESQQSKKKNFNYRSLLMFVTGSLIGLVIIIIAIFFIIRYGSNNRGSYAFRKSLRNPSRGSERSPTIPTSTDTSNTPGVLYTRLQSLSPSVTTDTDMFSPFDNPVMDDYDIQLLPKSTKPTKLHDNYIAEDEEEPFYSTVKDPYEK